MIARGAHPAYEMVVGLEVHVQLATRTKLLCACGASSALPPNTSICPVCLGLPGTLPVISLHAVELAVRAAIALECTVNPLSTFSRKHYFFPDLPKGYQVTQADEPLAESGTLEIGRRPDGSAITVGVVRLHMEEDPGRLLHDRYADAIAVDLNRAGVSLIEIVTAPEIRSPDAAAAFVRVLRERLLYAEVSDVSLELGSLRVDANISVRPAGELALGTRTEIKNLNTLTGLRRALEAEYARQCALLQAGQPVVSCTVEWDEAADVVRVRRAKESLEDYRLVPDPDLPPLVLDADWVARVKREMPELPDARRARLTSDYGLEEEQVEALIARHRLADYFEHAARHYCRERGDHRTVATWVLGEMLASLRDTGQSVQEFRVRPADLAALLGFLRAGTISHTVARRVWRTMARTGELPAQIIEREVLSRVADDRQLHE